MIAGTLEIQLLANMARLQKDMDDAKRAVGSAMSSISSAANVAKAALSGFAAGLSVTAIVSHARATIDAADAINDLSQRVGIAVKDLAKYELAASQSGTSMEALAKGIKSLSGNLLEHGDALKKAGITATTADDAMKQLANVFAGMPDGMEKTTLAVKMFGKSGMDLIPMLNMGSDGLDKAAEKSAKYAAQMAILAPQSDAFNDNMAELGMLSKISGMAMMNDFMPALIIITQAMADASQKGGMFKGVMAGIDEAANQMFDWSGRQQRKGIKSLTDDLADLHEAQSLITVDLFGRRGQIQLEIEGKTKALEAARKAYFGLTDGNAGRGSVNPASVKPQSDWMADYKAMMNALGGDSKAAAVQITDYQKLTRAIAEKQAVANLDLETQARMTEAQKYSAKFEADLLIPGTLKMTAGEIELTRAKMSTLVATELANAEKDKETKANLAASEAQHKYVETLTQGLDKLKAESLTQQEHNDRLGLSVEAIAALDAAKLESQAVTLDLMAIKALDKNLDEEQYGLYKAQAQELRKLAELKQTGAAKEAQVEVAKKAAEEWKRTADSINKDITDALMRGFENGKGFAENLRDTITNMFKTMILRPIVSAVVSPISQGFSSMLGGAGATSMGSNSLINGANTASSLSSFGGAAAQYWTGSSAGASSASLAYANGVGMVGGDSIGALSSANGGWAGVNASGGSAASGAAAGGASGSSMIPIIGWILAGMSASSSFYDQGHGWNGKYNALEPVMGATDGVLQGVGLDGKTAAIVSGSALIQGVLDKVGSWFDGGHEYTVGTGVQGKFSNGGFSGRNYQNWQNDGSPGIFGIGKTSGSSGTNYSAMGSAASNALGDAFVRVTDQVSGFAQSLGLSTDTIKGFSKDITVALGSDAAANKAAIDVMFAGIADDMSAAFLGTYETTVTQATGLLGGFLPDVVSTVFKPGALMKEGETASVTLVRLSTSLGQVNNSFDVLGKELLSLSLTSGDSASKLVDLLGGMDAFKATTSSYYEAFYTEGERNAKLLEQLTGSFDKMGVALPDSLQTYRDLVNAQDVNTESGRAMYASLMGMSGAFAQVTKAADDAANSVLSTLAYSNYVDYASAASASGMKALPRFAAGGMHAGGLRLVGENGPEIEATGPARIWNADQMAGALRGGPAAPTNDAAAAEIRAQREEARSQYRSMSLLYGRMLKIFEDWDRNGMPPGATA
jgi:hypothetical protein